MAREVSSEIVQKRSLKQPQTVCWISRSQVRLCDGYRMSRGQTRVACLNARFRSVRSQLSWVDNTVLCEWLAGCEVSLTTWRVLALALPLATTLTPHTYFLK